MNNIQKRFLLFLIGCIGLRSFFVYLAKILQTEYLRIMGFLALIPACGFLYIFFANFQQKRDIIVFLEERIRDAL